jgi:hypothetical protein
MPYSSYSRFQHVMQAGSKRTSTTRSGRSSIPSPASTACTSRWPSAARGWGPPGASTRHSSYWAEAGFQAVEIKKVEGDLFNNYYVAAKAAAA